jgi:hypothetical protein
MIKTIKVYFERKKRSAALREEREELVDACKDVIIYLNSGGYISDALRLQLEEEEDTMLKRLVEIDNEIKLNKGRLFKKGGD